MFAFATSTHHIELAVADKRRGGEGDDTRGANGGKGVDDGSLLAEGRIDAVLGGEQGVEARIEGEEEERADESEHVRVVDGRLLAAAHRVEVEELGRGQTERRAEQVHVDGASDVVCLIEFDSKAKTNYEIKHHRLSFIENKNTHLNQVDVDALVEALRDHAHEREHDELRERCLAENGAERHQHGDGRHVRIQQAPFIIINHIKFN